MAIRILLLVLAVGWTPYGMYCLVFPEFLGPIAGVEATAATGVAELRAMYGGLQIAVGLAALVGFLRSDYIERALWVQVVAVGGIGGGRLIGLLVGGDASGYTLGALAFEGLTLALCVAALRARPKTA
ncbi:hypothetical protein FHR99_002619 [Litorivivens lipolytica]|uniref:DUF4345 domain-containing protein n=1 Tax=Litorivivens lipolytica TaxID=1524264 RepID=A0A7W4W6Q7_9GAMM|nr:DUF4345 family protein [Litorivivens lipolytica]MBB3048345.1 hypothetical protein [Litorivivens lipolytica]